MLEISGLVPTKRFMLEWSIFLRWTETVLPEPLAPKHREQLDSWIKYMTRERQVSSLKIGLQFWHKRFLRDCPQVREFITPEHDRHFENMISFLGSPSADYDQLGDAEKQNFPYILRSLFLPPVSEALLRAKYEPTGEKGPDPPVIDKIDVDKVLAGADNLTDNPPTDIIPTLVPVVKSCPLCQVSEESPPDDEAIVAETNCTCCYHVSCLESVVSVAHHQVDNPTEEETDTSQVCSFCMVSRTFLSIMYEVGLKGTIRRPPLPEGHDKGVFDFAARIKLKPLVVTYGSSEELAWVVTGIVMEPHRVVVLPDVLKTDPVFLMLAASPSVRWAEVAPHAVPLTPYGLKLPYRVLNSVWSSISTIAYELVSSDKYAEVYYLPERKHASSNSSDGSAEPVEMGTLSVQADPAVMQYAFLCLRMTVTTAACIRAVLWKRSVLGTLTGSVEVLPAVTVPSVLPLEFGKQEADPRPRNPASTLPQVQAIKFASICNQPDSFQSSLSMKGKMIQILRQVKANRTKLLDYTSCRAILENGKNCGAAIPRRLSEFTGRSYRACCISHEWDLLANYTFPCSCVQPVVVVRQIGLCFACVAPPGCKAGQPRPDVYYVDMCSAGCLVHDEKDKVSQCEIEGCSRPVCGKHRYKGYCGGYIKNVCHPCVRRLDAELPRGASNDCVAGSAELEGDKATITNQLFLSHIELLQRLLTNTVHEWKPEVVWRPSPTQYLTVKELAVKYHQIPITEQGENNYAAIRAHKGNEEVYVAIMRLDVTRGQGSIADTRLEMLTMIRSEERPVDMLIRPQVLKSWVELRHGVGPAKHRRAANELLRSFLKAAFWSTPVVGISSAQVIDASDRLVWAGTHLLTYPEKGPKRTFFVLEVTHCGTPKTPYELVTEDGSKYSSLRWVKVRDLVTPRREGASLAESEYLLALHQLASRALRFPPVRHLFIHLYQPKSIFVEPHKHSVDMMEVKTNYRVVRLVVSLNQTGYLILDSTR